jgi:hypothetical protein
MEIKRIAIFLTPLKYYQIGILIFAVHIQNSNHRGFKSSIIYSYRNQTGNYFPSMENITRIMDRKQKSGNKKQKNRNQGLLNVKFAMRKSERGWLSKKRWTFIFQNNPVWQKCNL